MKKTMKCAYCGREFTTTSGNRKYCSEECMTKAHEEKQRRRLDFLTAVDPIIDLKSQEYLTFSKAAILMGCSRQYIYKLVNEGRLQASRMSARMSFVRKTDIEAMLEGNPYHRILPTALSRTNGMGRKGSDAPSRTRTKCNAQSPASPMEANPLDGEVPTYLSVEEVMKRYKVKKSWLYTAAKRNGIPLCRIAGHNYYSRKHLDELLAAPQENERIREWITAGEIVSQFGIAPQSIHAAVYRHHIPTKREYGVTYYAKSSFEALKRPDIANDGRYCTTLEAAGTYGLTTAAISAIVKAKQLTKVRIGVRNMLLKEELDAVMAARLAQYGSYRIF